MICTRRCKKASPTTALFKGANEIANEFKISWIFTRQKSFVHFANDKRRVIDSRLNVIANEEWARWIAMCTHKHTDKRTDTHTSARIETRHTQKKGRKIKIKTTLMESTSHTMPKLTIHISDGRNNERLKSINVVKTQNLIKEVAVHRSHCIRNKIKCDTLMYYTMHVH